MGGACCPSTACYSKEEVPEEQGTPWCSGLYQASWEASCEWACQQGKNTCVLLTDLHHQPLSNTRAITSSPQNTATSTVSQPTTQGPCSVHGKGEEAVQASQAGQPLRLRPVPADLCGVLLRRTATEPLLGGCERAQQPG